MTVEEGVRLEVLDWGGTGRPVVLLAGGGNTAHVFDDFGLKLRGGTHVYGITRRGFGSSGYSGSPDPVARLSDDVLAVMDALGLDKPVLVGHSIAGAELSAVAISHPGRIAGLVYLEAGYPYAFTNGSGPTMAEFQQINAPEHPTPHDSDLRSFATLQKWDERVYGFRTPEAELRKTWDSTSDGRPAKPRDFPGSQSLMAILTATEFRNIPVPALVIFAIPHAHENWMESATDPAVRDAALRYFAKIDRLTERQAKALENGVPTARVVRFRGMHYIFLSNEPDVLREMRLFLSGLK